MWRAAGIMSARILCVGNHGVHMWIGGCFVRSEFLWKRTGGLEVEKVGLEFFLPPLLEHRIVLMRVGWLERGGFVSVNAGETILPLCLVNTLEIEHLRFSCVR